jgi:eukaryotic-like serine/threonine-protein kinase
VSDEAVPEKIGRYEIRRELGRGMMGVVYEAKDPALNRVVALKVIRLLFATSGEEKDAFERRFLSEARIAASLSHPGIVVVHEVDRDPETGVLFIALERLEGEPLSRILADNRRPPWRQAISIVGRVAEALGYAHGRGVVHRDVKPANIMRLPSGEPKIMDFGLAKQAQGQELTGTGHFVGTPLYMAPEQVLGLPIDGRTDLFSLGAVAYTLVTGQKPFAAESVPRIMAKVAHQHPPPPSSLVPDLPPAVDYVIGRAMAKAPIDRYPHGQAMAEDIADLLADREPRHRAGWTPPETGEGTLASRRPEVEVEPLDLPLQSIEDLRPVVASSRRRKSQPLGVLAVGMLVAGLLAVGLSALWPARVGETLHVAPSAPATMGASASPSSPPSESPSPPASAAVASSPAPPTPVTLPVTSAPAPEAASVNGRLLLRVEGEAAGSVARVFVDDAPVLERGFDLLRADSDPIPVTPGSHLVRVQVNRVDRIDTQELRGTFESDAERVLSVRLNPEGGLEIGWK